MKVGAIVYATAQGLGHLARDYYENGVIDEVLIFKHPHRETRWEWYPPGTPVISQRPFRGPEVDAFLGKIDLLLCFETPFDWTFPRRVRDAGKRTAVMPMYEWTLSQQPHQFDVILNPSALDLQYFSHSARQRSVFVPVPASPYVTWKQRDWANHFVHNAGHVGSRSHKGTEEILQAIALVKAPIRLTVRCQDKPALDRLITAYPHVLRDRRIEFVTGDVARESLFADGDVYIAPEKYNGLSLPLQEAYAAGMAVAASDRFPANSLLPSRPLVPVAEYRKAHVAPGYIEFDEAIITPEAVAETVDDLYGSDISVLSAAGKQWAELNSWANLKPRILEALA